MRRFFNTTGLCSPTKHYMVDPFRQLYADVERLIEDQQYFVIHAPRKTGKTTFLHALAHRLNQEGRYVSIVCSLESAGYPSISVEDANNVFIRSIYQTADVFLPPEHLPPDPYEYAASPQLLRQYLTDWCLKLPKPLILLLDEIDALYDEVLISTLRQLRDGFQTRPRKFPQSIALVGLRDIREYSLRSHNSDPATAAGSPFNIRAKSFALPTFSREEVRDLLDQHSRDTGQLFTSEVFEKIYEYTGGQSWLTNAIANEMVAEMFKNDYSRPILPGTVEEAMQRLVEQRHTHIDGLAKKIQDPRVRPVIMSIITGDTPDFDGFDDALRYCRDLGIIGSTDPIRFANPINREIIIRHLNAGLERAISHDIAQPAHYLQADGSLNMDKLLDAFIDFYCLQAESWLARFEYKEAGHPLLLMAFLQRILQGGGQVDREMAIGNGRTELTVYWREQVIPLQIRMLQDARSQSAGLQQLGRQLARLGQQRGYLLLFEKKSLAEVPWRHRLRREQCALNEGKVVLLGM